MLSKFWKRRNKAVKNWRSRAWSIDLRVTKLTIIKDEESEGQVVELESNQHSFTHSNGSPRWLERYPQYCNSIADMEQLG